MRKQFFAPSESSTVSVDDMCEGIGNSICLANQEDMES